MQVWLLTLELASPVPEGAWALLDEAERVRCLRFAQLADRVRFACTRATLRTLLASRLGCAPRDVVFEFGPNGKPAAADPRAPRFNVSHSGEHALLAMSARREVGVDIERHLAAEVLPELMDVFTPPERAQCRQGQDVQAFFDLWAAKEAVLKAWGEGIGERLQQMTVRLTPGGPHGLSVEGGGPPTLLWPLAVPASGYSAALALSA